ncbi:MAG: hypothetical protein HFE63_04590 [Clostridiales bacterium]|nr:hypothetical protein [Clostridiales bacterium]
MNNNRRPTGQNGGAQSPNQRQPQNGQPRSGQQRYDQYNNQPPQNQAYRNNNLNAQANNVRRNPNAQYQRTSSNGSLSRINSQNPNQRRAEPKKIKLTAEQIEINRVNRQRERYYIKKHRSAAIRTFISRFMLFLVVFAVLCGITASLFFMNLTRKDSPDVSSYTYKIGNAKAQTLSHNDAVRDGNLYVSFTDIAELCNLAVIGSVDDIKYVIKGDEAETIRFLTGTRVVYVNTVEARLSSDSYYKNDKLYVPLDFVSAYFKGLNITVDEKNHQVTVAREILNELDEKGNIPKGEEIIYGELYFLLQTPSTLTNINESEIAASVGMPELGFATNLSAYEEYMNPGNTTAYLTLVNVDHTLDSSFTPQDLTSVVNTRQDGRATQMMALYAEKALEAMFKELEAAGYTDISVTSAYRSYSSQEYNFNTRLNSYTGISYEEAYKRTAEVINPPGASEHQTGLCCDMHNLPGADIAFGSDPAFTWLKENCWKFGFILRYPQDKVDITGISWEPWHYRYVGRYHAQKIYEMNMCLEEYYEYLGLD